MNSNNPIELTRIFDPEDQPEFGPWGSNLSQNWVFVLDSLIIILGLNRIKTIFEINPIRFDLFFYPEAPAKTDPKMGSIQLGYLKNWVGLTSHYTCAIITQF